MNLPTWQDFKKGLQAFEQSLSKHEVKAAADFEKFQEQHPVLDAIIENSIPFLPPPINGIAENIYRKLGRSKVDSAKEILNFLHIVESQGAEHFEKVFEKLGTINADMAKEETLISIREMLTSSMEKIDRKLDSLPTIEKMVGLQMNDKEKSAFILGLHSANLASAKYTSMSPAELASIKRRFVFMCNHIGITLTEEQKALLLDETTEAMIRFYTIFSEQASFGLDRYLIAAIVAGQNISFILGAINHPIQEDIIEKASTKIKNSMTHFIPNGLLANILWQFLVEIEQYQELKTLTRQETNDLQQKLLRIVSPYFA